MCVGSEGNGQRASGGVKLGTGEGPIQHSCAPVLGAPWVMRPGYTLVELAFVVLLLGMTGLMVLPSVHRLGDRMAVVGAREAVAGLFAEARIDALQLGGATVRIRSGPWRAWAEAGDSVLGRVDLARDFSVSVSIGRGGSSADVHYDALGMGQVASETLTFLRGDERTELVISGYGRVRRR